MDGTSQMSDARPHGNGKRAKWVLDRFLLERSLPTGQPNLADALLELGHEIFVTEFRRGSQTPSDDLPLWNGDCVVTYGSHQFVSQITRARAGSWQPGAYHRVEMLSYSAYSPHIGDLMLNDDFVILPYGEFRRRGVGPWGGAAFIRPDAVTKSFTGFVITEKDFGHETNSLERIGHLQPEDLLAVARPKPILGEFRFVIADRKVVTGSAYSWDRKLDVRSDIDPACLQMAQEVSRREWQSDSVYTCDVALTEIGGRPVPRVLELNAFSCSGLYACDTRKIAEAVSSAAAREWAGDDLDDLEPAVGVGTTLLRS